MARHSALVDHTATDAVVADEAATDAVAEPVDPAAIAADGTAMPAGWIAWLRLGSVVAARAVLALIGGLLIWAVVPLALGWHPTTVMTGSMQPRLMVGDVAVSRPAHPGGLKINQVLLFDDPDHPGRLRLHRFVRVDQHGLLVTRGDANPTEDSTHLQPTAVRGIGTLRVPVIGLPRVWIQEGDWARVGIVAAALALAGILACTSPARTDPAESGTDRVDGGGSRPAVRRFLRPGRHAALAAGATACLTVGLVVVAGATGSWATYAGSFIGAAGWTAAGTYGATSTLTVDPAPDPSGWYVASSVSVTVSATAPSGSRVATVNYRIGTAGTVTTTGSSVTFVVATQGTTTVSYWATDGAGRTETAHTTQIQLDQTKPSLAVTSPSSTSLSHADWAKACAADVTGGGICGQTDDGNGIGVATVNYTLQDSKGRYWTGQTFAAKLTTIAAQLTAAGHWYSSIPDTKLDPRTQTYTLTVTSTDKLGNARTITMIFTVG